MRAAPADGGTRLASATFLMWTVSYYLFGGRAETIAYTEYLLWTTVAAVGFQLLRGARFPLGLPVAMGGAFVAYGAASYFWSWRPEATAAKAQTMLLILALFTVLWMHFGGLGGEYVVWTLCIAGIILSAYVILREGLGAYALGLLNGERMSGEVNNANALAMQTGMAAVICFWFAVHRGRRTYFLWASLPVIVTLGTGSRKGLVLLLGGIALLYGLALAPGRRARVILGAAVVILGTAVIIQLPAFGTVTERMGGMLGFLQDTTVDYSAAIRQEMITVGLDQFRQTPLLGIGLGASGLLTAARFGDDTYLHNNYVELLATLGMVGCILYYALFAHLLARLAPRVRNRGGTAVIAVVILTMQIVMDYGAVTYDDKFTWVHLLVGFLALRESAPRSRDVTRISRENVETGGTVRS